MRLVVDHSQLASGPQHDGALQGLKRGFSGFYSPDPALLGEQAQSQPLLPPATRLWKYWSKITSFGEGFSRPEFCARRPGEMEHYARRVGTVTVQRTLNIRRTSTAQVLISRSYGKVGPKVDSRLNRWDTACMSIW